MVNLVREIIALFRPHKFDLEHPEIITTGMWGLYGEITYTKFTCLKCGISYCLDLWQMKDLPRSMRYGCGGRKKHE